jgi:sugar phosphate isomerase/epimerase
VKLAVSNIAWGNDDLPGHLQLLKRLGCAGVEIAPSIIWEEPAVATAVQRRDLRALVEQNGLLIVGLHSLFYTRPDLNILGGEEAQESALRYMQRLIELCAALGGKTMVFGSPQGRKRGPLTLAQAMDRAALFFCKTGEMAEEYGVYVLIEPLGPDETDFITSSAQGMALVSQVNHPHFRLHLDAKAMISVGEDFDEVCHQYAGQYKHFHVGDPGLAPPGSTGVDHAPLGRALRNAGYDGFVSIEMRRGFGPSYEVIRRSVDYVKHCYLET